MYLVAMVMTGAPVGTPGKGPLDPAMSMWEYGRGASESTPCCIGLKQSYFKYRKDYLSTCQVILIVCSHLVKPWGHDEESCRGLMSSWCSRGWQVVALQNVLILRLALVEVVVLSSDSGHLKHVSQHLSSCNQGGKTHNGNAIEWEEEQSRNTEPLTEWLHLL